MEKTKKNVTAMKKKKGVKMTDYRNDRQPVEERKRKAPGEKMKMEMEMEEKRDDYRRNEMACKWAANGLQMGKRRDKNRDSFTFGERETAGVVKGPSQPTPPGPTLIDEIGARMWACDWHPIGDPH